ncbi:hypothetical protein NEOCIP111885_02198 [Pseudoneobacillus rhizosphaerae]|uniref:Uncharacterized protein n=1 Tax=Pseudoneobacillus rhizosphaerae TaxID=2880968 RepID=A0A9C7G9U1_9BACI|nr:hypothetical protein NEOCIP111885_02198 [Pseudoneobacillus rhizosphaerae]
MKVRADPSYTFTPSRFTIYPAARSEASQVNVTLVVVAVPVKFVIAFGGSGLTLKVVVFLMPIAATSTV